MTKIRFLGKWDKFCLYRIPDDIDFSKTVTGMIKALGGDLLSENSGETGAFKANGFLDITRASSNIHAVRMHMFDNPLVNAKTEPFRGSDGNKEDRLDFESDFPSQLGAILKCPWIWIATGDHAYWEYQYFLGDKLQDQFSTVPMGPYTADYDEYIADKTYYDEIVLAHQGNPKLLADAFSVELKSIDRYFRHWENVGERTLEEYIENGLLLRLVTFKESYQENEKAYLSDQFCYGDYRQVIDFLKAFGLDWDQEWDLLFKLSVPEMSTMNYRKRLSTLESCVCKL